MSEIFREMVEDKKVPEHRSCVYCWHYWCGNCGTGLGGMYGICNYEFCMTGYKNKLNY